MGRANRDRSMCKPLPMKFETLHRWTYNGQQFEVNNFHHGDAEAWCYELYAIPSEPDRNDYIEVRIPDATPDGPFTPASASEALLLAHGEPRIPWPILCRLIALMRQ